MAPQTSVPPSLPPSVEEAYRRKCVQLKNRTNEVEESNHAARLRLARIKRQVEKLRLERAFLLEQLAKRTSANVEDSEGSPSPPPTPKDKPLRIKRGHRKASIGGDADGKASAAGDITELVDGSPSKKPSTAASRAQQRRRRSRTNGVSPAPPASAFDLFVEEKREAQKSQDDASELADADIEAEWKDLPEEDKDAVTKRWEELKEKHKKQEEDAEAEAEAEEEEAAAAEAEADGEGDGDGDGAATPRPAKDGTPKAGSKSPVPEKASASAAATQDEDVEMADNDTEDGDTQMDKDGDD